MKLDFMLRQLRIAKKVYLHGAYMYVLQDENGFIQEAHSISAGLDYPGVGPEHSHLHDIGRVKYTSVTDAEALEGLQVIAESRRNYSCA